MTNKKTKSASLGRRDVLKAAGVGALALAGGTIASRPAYATPESASKALRKLIGDKATKKGKVSLKLPEIAENGRTVPVTISVDTPQTSADYVKTIHVLSEGNPFPNVVSLNLTPGSGKAEVSTRMRLGKTQKVVAAAVMNDGSIYTTKRMVKVTIGGCGG